MLRKGGLRRLEAGPFGATRILLGDTLQGEALDCPLPADGVWQMVGINDCSLGQTAHQITRGSLWVEGMSPGDVADIPVASLSEIIVRIGPHHLDLTGAKTKADGLPQGPFEQVSGVSVGSAYPCLWNHDASRERMLLVEPDSHCRIREVNGEVPDELVSRAQARWATAARAHYNLDLQFNSQSLTVAMTERPSIGGRAWPTVVFEDPACEYAFALWSNSTLGLLCHWWEANKSQAGRGTATVTSISRFTTLNLRKLSANQHTAAKSAFEEMSNIRFLPYDQISEDSARSELDKRLMVDVLGLSPDLCASGGPMDRLRAKLAAEPQIHSGKRTRVVFTDTGEIKVPL